jgi:hypothetical protein
MGTAKSHAEKVGYIKSLLGKKKPIPLKVVMSNLIISFGCDKRTAKELIEAFVDGSHAEIVQDGGEELFSG